MNAPTDAPTALDIDIARNSIAHDSVTDGEVAHDAATLDDGTQRGASLVEYALLVALIALVCIAAVTLLGGTTSSQFSSIADGLN